MWYNAAVREGTLQPDVGVREYFGFMGRMSISVTSNRNSELMSHLSTEVTARLLVSQLDTIQFIFQAMLQFNRQPIWRTEFGGGRLVKLFVDCETLFQK